MGMSPAFWCIYILSEKVCLSPISIVIGNIGMIWN